MIKAWTEEAWEDFEYWTTQDRRMLFVAAGSVVVVALNSAVVITVIRRIINADVSLG